MEEWAAQSLANGRAPSDLPPVLLGTARPRFEGFSTDSPCVHPPTRRRLRACQFPTYPEAEESPVIPFPSPGL